MTRTCVLWRILVFSSSYFTISRSLFVSVNLDGRDINLHFEETDSLKTKASEFVSAHRLHELRGTVCDSWPEAALTKFECIVDNLTSHMKREVHKIIAHEVSIGARAFEINSQISSSLIVIDDFLSHPEAMREWALAQQFIYKGNHPGRRTASFANNKAFRAIRRQVETAVGEKLPYWFASFQQSFHNDTDNGVHRDYPTYKYSAVLFLTPGIDSGLGTSTWRNNENGLYAHPTLRDALSRNTTVEALLSELIGAPEEFKYTEIDRIGNRFNRLLIFDSRLNHRSSRLGGSGDGDNDSRLIMILFFNTEDPIGQEGSILWYDLDGAAS